MADLETYLRQSGHSPERFPFVLQCNKQDLPSALDPSVLRGRLARNGHPCFAAAAIFGSGVLDTLKAIINQVVRRLR
jgi:hypothetical protein